MRTHALLPDGKDVEVRAYGRNERFRFAPDDAHDVHDAYQVERWDGIAWYVLGWEVEPDEDTEWSGMENLTGRLLAVMVGDDSPQSFDPEDVKPLAREEYCGVCGQIGCSHDGLDRSES